jgi:hypothetical protein
MIYVYAISDGAASAPAPTGVGGRPVRAVRDGSLTAFVSDGPAPEAEPEALWSHERVVASLMEGAAVLPLRFGTVLDGEAPLRAVLGDRRDELERSLERVRGKVEFGVRALWRERSRDATHDGREYMVGRLERLRTARRAADAVDRPLGELAAETRCHVTADDDAAFVAAYLVDGTHGAEFARRARRLRDARDDVRLVCTGPWAPYSFAEAGGA